AACGRGCGTACSGRPRAAGARRTGAPSADPSWPLLLLRAFGPILSKKTPEPKFRQRLPRPPSGVDVEPKRLQPPDKKGVLLVFHRRVDHFVFARGTDEEAGSHRDAFLFRLVAHHAR